MKRRNNDIGPFSKKMKSHSPAEVKVLRRFTMVASLAGALLSCTPAVMEPKQSVPTAKAQVSENQNAAKSATIVPATPTESQALRVQELSARQELGQTTVFLKLSRPIAQYRHFPLAQPARILLDIFTETKDVGET